MASRAVFGISIEESLEVAQIANLPAVVFRCIQYLETKKAELEEGIYRLSGSSAVIKSLKDRFNVGVWLSSPLHARALIRDLEGDVDLLASDEYWDPHAIAGLLKTYMRDLPGSLLTRELHTRFLSVIGTLQPALRSPADLLILLRLCGCPRTDQRAVKLDCQFTTRKLLPTPGPDGASHFDCPELWCQQDDNEECWDCVQPNVGYSCWRLQFDAGRVQSCFQR